VTRNRSSTRSPLKLACSTSRPRHCFRLRTALCFFSSRVASFNVFMLYLRRLEQKSRVRYRRADKAYTKMSHLPLSVADSPLRGIVPDRRQRREGQDISDLRPRACEDYYLEEGSGGACKYQRTVQGWKSRWSTRGRKSYMDHETIVSLSEIQTEKTRKR
jgi:hypothetical protein